MACRHILEHGIVHKNLQFYGNRGFWQFQHRVVGKGNNYHIRLGSIYGNNRPRHFRNGFSNIGPFTVSNLRIPFAIFHLELSQRSILAVLSVGPICTHLLTIHQQPLAVQRPVVIAVSVFPDTYGRCHAIRAVFSVLSTQDGLFHCIAVFIHKDEFIAGTVRQFSGILDKVFTINKILDKAHLGIEFLNLLFHLGQALFNICQAAFNFLRAAGKK